ncbi:MAG TPA: 3D domain-containing protein [Archangium sp.]|uniref:3D domain-containing protein n=1 Tax=Archangium sp. TaxID=1872627 RepID=UPI002E303381|nr:3D domain-containing protein [Archangium sp.]HEX5748545.1 3D domain-containing protein [Archangium sp.]
MAAGEWMEGFTITHYIIVMESDPVFALDKKVKAHGLEGEYREGFLYKAKTGVIFQGTGQTEAGEFITIDWNKGRPKGRDTWFTLGTGGAWKKPVAWESVAVDRSVIPLGSRLEIDIYPKRTFVAWDTGGAINGKHIDIFLGPTTLAEANALGRKKARVRILK